MATAYFDVDGTLVGTNLLHPAIAMLSRDATPFRSARRLGGAILQAPRLAAAELRDRRRFNELLFQHYRGLSEDRIVELSRELFDEVVRPKIFAGTIELIDACKRAGLRVVLITGSLEETVEPLRAHLGADGLIANRLEFHDGIATGKLRPPVVAGPVKARLIADDAREVGHDLSACQAYSDSFSDVPMLSVVGHPFCVHPDGKLRNTAQAYHWPILDLTRPSPGESRETHAP